MVSQRNRPRKPKGQGPEPRLAHELLSELNATYYEDDPSEYLHTRIEVVTLMLASEEALTPACTADRIIGATRRAKTPVPPREVRDRYVRTECVLVLHHACETLLRMFLRTRRTRTVLGLGWLPRLSSPSSRRRFPPALRAASIVTPLLPSSSAVPTPATRR
jgi:hypothetical protein